MDFMIPIVTGLLGYQLSKTPQPKSGDGTVRTTISSNDLNTNTDTYSSTFTKQASAVERQLADAKYIQSRDPSSTNIIPPFYNDLASTSGPAPAPFPGSVNTSSSSLPGTILPTVSQIDPQQAVQNKVNSVMNSPMFTAFNNMETTDYAAGGNGTIIKEAFSALPSGVSQLSGCTFDTNTTNMVPFFGSSVKQNTDPNKTQVTLDRHTGNDRHLQKHKVENKPMFALQPQNTFGTQVSQDRSRFYQSNLKTGLLPLPQIKEAPLPPDAFRGQYKTDNQLNVKQRYTNRTADPISGVTAAIVSQPTAYNKNRPETAFRSGVERTFVGGPTKGALPLNYTNGKARPGEDSGHTAGAYSGNGLSLPGPRQINVDSDGDFSDVLKDINNVLFSFSDTLESKRDNYKVDGFRNVSRKSTDPLKSIAQERDGYHQYPENERETTTTDRMGVAGDSKRGIELRNKQKSRTTIKESTLYSYTGDAVSNNKKGPGYTGKSTKKTNKIMAKDYIYNPNGSRLGRRDMELAGDGDIKTERENFQDNKNYTLKYKLGNKIARGADDINTTRQKSDYSYDTTPDTEGGSRRRKRVGNIDNIYNDIPVPRNYGTTKTTREYGEIDAADRIGREFTQQLLGNDLHIDINRKRKR